MTGKSESKRENEKKDDIKFIVKRLPLKLSEHTQHTEKMEH